MSASQPSPSAAAASQRRFEMYQQFPESMASHPSVANDVGALQLTCQGSIIWQLMRNNFIITSQIQFQKKSAAESSNFAGELLQGLRSENAKDTVREKLQQRVYLLDNPLKQSDKLKEKLARKKHKVTMTAREKRETGAFDISTCDKKYARTFIDESVLLLVILITLTHLAT